jgi:HK97 family phage major capsid protein
LTKLFDDAQKQLQEINVFGYEKGDIAKKSAEQKTKAKTGSLGERFVNAGSTQEMIEKAVRAVQANQKGMHLSSEAVGFDGMKDIISGSNVTDGAGLLVPSDRLGLVDTGRFFRPLSAVQLFTTIPAQSDKIDWVIEKTFTNNAAVNPEAQGVEPYSAGAGQVKGAAAQSGFTLENKNVDIKAIEHWMPVTRRSLADASILRGIIDSFLVYGIQEELEDQCVVGDGEGDNFTGMLETSGIQSQAWDTDLLTTTRRAKTKVRTVGRARASAYLFNPADNERFDLMRDNSGYGDNTGGFMFGAPTGLQVQSLWGLPRIECEAIPEGTGLVADFSKAVLFDRQQLGISVSTDYNDFFIRGLAAVLASMRAGFVVQRPLAFVEIDLTEASS